jgi:hypothetical protein
VTRRASCVPASPPLAETLTRESSGFQRRTTAHAHEQFCAWREGRHDDLLLVMAVALWLAERNAGPPPDGFFADFGQLGAPRVSRTYQRVLTFFLGIATRPHSGGSHR